MSITSLQFIIFFVVSLVIYYLVPKKSQWICLLIFSGLFFLLSSNWITGIYMIVCICTTDFCAKKMSQYNEKKILAKRYLLLGIGINAGMLIALKYSNFVIENILNMLSLFGLKVPQYRVNLSAPIGISYYTLQVIAYLVDLYGEITECEKNIFKTALFIGYYPQLTSGPIAKHSDMKNQLYEGHVFNIDRIVFGIQRILWGMFKKLVISSRLGVIVDTIYSDIDMYNGLYIWIAAFAFLIQLYTDFSGCMDIIIGVSECYGIILPENFDSPFFSRSVQEFWQRWHITLGGWLRDYIMYPLMRTETWRRMTKKIKGKWGKKAAKQIPSYLAMLVVWLMFGLWHGGDWKFILGEGMFCYLCILLAKLFEPLFKKIIDVFNINTECFSWHLWQSFRVFVLMSVANMFFKLETFGKTIKALKMAVINWNPWILFDRSLFSLGLSEKNVKLVGICLLLLIAVECLKQKERIRKQISNQNIVFRWSIWIILFFSVVIFGEYGTGYDASSFIYGNF